MKQNPRKYVNWQSEMGVIPYPDTILRVKKD